MQQIDAIPSERSTGLRRTLLLLLPALALFVVLIGVSLWRASGSLPFGARSAQAGGFPISPEMEDEFGVRFTGISVVARGGLVDLRYRVIDAGKAKTFGHYTETSPLLIAQDSGKPVEVTIMGLHNHRVEAGRIYYILYRNTGNVIVTGRPVTIQVGDLILKDCYAK